MTVFGLVSSVAGFVKVRYLIDKAVIDNMVFRMHYRITSAILFLCCILVTANNLIGKSNTHLIKQIVDLTAAFPQNISLKVNKAPCFPINRRDA